MLAPSQVVCIFGRRGWGKTTRAKAEVKGCLRLLIWDPLGEYGKEDCPAAVIHDLPSFMDYPLESLSAFRVSYRPIEDAEEIEWFLRVAHAIGNLTLLLEEVDTVCSPSFTPFDLKRVLRRGRHRGISVIGVSRNPAEVSRDLTRACERLILYGMHEPRDLEYFRSFGVNASALTTLDKFQPYQHTFA